MAKDFEYERRRPEQTELYKAVQAELESVLSEWDMRERPAPRFVERELRAFLKCGILAHGFARIYCPGCPRDEVVAFS